MVTMIMLAWIISALDVRVHDNLFSMSHVKAGLNLHGCRTNTFVLFSSIPCSCYNKYRGQEECLI